MSERPRPRHHVLECLGEKPPGSGSKACGRYVHRSIGAVALVLFAASCGSLPEEPPLRPTSRPPPHAVQPEQLSEAPIEHHTLPSACVDGGSMCTVPVDFAERLCRGLYPEVALHLFGPKTPWKRAFLLRSFKAWHVGSRSDLRELRTGEEVIILSLAAVTIESSVCISQRAFLCTGSHDFRSPGFSLVTKAITVRSGSWIAAQAFIGPGVEIGDGSMVAAGSVVTENVPPRVIVRGNPAMVVKQLA